MVGRQLCLGFRELGQGTTGQGLDSRKVGAARQALAMEERPLAMSLLARAAFALVGRA